MSHYILSDRARHDLRGIWKRSAANWGVSQAEDYVTSITDALDELAAGQRPFQRVEVSGRPYRRNLIGSHLIFCRQDPANNLLVVRMDIARHLRS